MNRASCFGLCLILGPVVGCEQAAVKTYLIRSSSPASEQLKSSEKSPLFQTTDDPQTIVDRLIEAYGGEEKCERWRCGRMVCKVTFMEKWTSETEEVFQLPGKFKRTVWPVNGRDKKPILEFAINGDQGWATTPSGAIVPLVERNEAA